MKTIRLRSLYTLLMLIVLFPISVAQTASGLQVERVMISGSVGQLSAEIQVPQLAKGKKCPMVILAHGFGGNKDASLLRQISDQLQAQGIASLRFDFNGHGKSEGAFQDMTVPNEIEDLKRIYQYVQTQPYVNGKIGLAGHSQGGVVVGMTAGELGDKISAIVLMAPAAVLRDDAIRGNTFGKSYNPMDPPEYVLLPGDKKLGREFIRTAFRLPIYETSAKYRGPACIIHGTGDRVVPFTYGERYHSIWPGSELHILEGADHGFSKEEREVATTAARYLIRYLKQ